MSLSMDKAQLRQLSTIKAGQTVRIARIDAGRGLNHRLASMGLATNTEITVINNSHPGPFVISLKGSRIILGRGMAHKIKVF